MDLWDELEQTPSAWLSEVALFALTWPRDLPEDMTFTSWVYGAYKKDAPELLDSREFYSTVSEEPVFMARTLMPENLPLSEIKALPGAEATILLSYQYVAEMQTITATTSGVYRLLIPPRENFPHDPPSAMVPAESARHAVLLATAVSKEGNIALMAEPLQSKEQNFSQVAALVDVENGVFSFEPHLLPIPWVRLAQTGSAQVSAQQVASPPALPLSSLWLQELLEAAHASDDAWYRALNLPYAWSKFHTWTDIFTDQASNRKVLGDLVPADVARRAGENFFALLLMSTTPAPPPLLSSLMHLGLSPQRTAELNEALAVHDELSRWLFPSHPVEPPAVWK